MVTRLTVDVDGVAVRLDATDAGRAGFVRQQVSAFAVVPDAEALATLHCGDRAPVTPLRPADVRDRSARLWFGEGRLAIAAYGWAGSASGGRADVGGPGRAVDPPLGWMIQRTLGWLLAPHDRYVLHDVGAIAHRGRAWLIVGPSGRGKSTLVLAAATSGWSALSDEAVVVSGTRRSLRVAGIHQHPAVPAELDHPLVESGEPLGDFRRRVRLAPGFLTPGWWPVDGVLIVDHSLSSCGALEEVRPNETLRAVVGAFGSTGAPGGTRFLMIAAVLAALPAFRLSHGTDPQTRLRVAAAALARVVGLSDAGQSPPALRAALADAAPERDDFRVRGPAG
jgi:hypothetical protein